MGRSTLFQDTLYYSIVGPADAQALFFINSLTGVITVQSPLNDAGLTRNSYVVCTFFFLPGKACTVFDLHLRRMTLKFTLYLLFLPFLLLQLNVQIADQRAPRQVVNVGATVNVVRDQFAPVWLNVPRTLTVLETVDVNFVIYTLSARDDDRQVSAPVHFSGCMIQTRAVICTS